MQLYSKPFDLPVHITQAFYIPVESGICVTAETCDDAVGVLPDSPLDKGAQLHYGSSDFEVQP